MHSTASQVTRYVQWMACILWFEIYIQYTQIKLFYQGASLLFSGVFPWSLILFCFFWPSHKATNSIYTRMVCLSDKYSSLCGPNYAVLTKENTDFTGSFAYILDGTQRAKFISAITPLTSIHLQPGWIGRMCFFPGSNQSYWTELGLVFTHQ